MSLTQEQLEAKLNKLFPNRKKTIQEILSEPKKKPLAKVKLTDEQQAIYNSTLESIQLDLPSASAYAKKSCSQCQGRGYYQVDTILPHGVSMLVEGKESRSTPIETKVCSCVEQSVKTEALKI